MMHACCGFIGCIRTRTDRRRPIPPARRAACEPPLQVAAYCRVSTDALDQARSLESQARYFSELIEKNPDWLPAGVYADEGLSGTSLKKRAAFNRMVEAALSGGIDLILTREVSRFARNAVDALQVTRELARRGVGVVFLADNIRSPDPDAELRLTILSSIAQEESRRTSERVKWGQRRSMERGVVFGWSLLGYDVKNGETSVDESGADIVRRIFDLYLDEGKGAQSIARELTRAGVPAAAGGHWNASVVLRILKNEKYCGDLVQRKTYTPDYLTHEKKQNRGAEERIVLAGHHEPIVSRERFERAQAEFSRRAAAWKAGTKHSGRQKLSGKIRCGACGRRFVARLFWRCCEAHQNGAKRTLENGGGTGCANASRIPDATLFDLVHRALSLLPVGFARAGREASDILRAALRAGGADESARAQALERTRSALTRLAELYVAGDVSAEHYYKKKRELAAKKRSLESAPAHAAEHETRGAHTERLLVGILSGEERDESFLSDLVEEIVVCDRAHVGVFLRRCGEVLFSMDGDGVWR